MDEIKQISQQCSELSCLKCSCLPQPCSEYPVLPTRLNPASSVISTISHEGLGPSDRPSVQQPWLLKAKLYPRLFKTTNCWVKGFVCRMKAHHFHHAEPMIYIPACDRFDGDTFLRRNPDRFWKCLSRHKNAIFVSFHNADPVLHTPVFDKCCLWGTVIHL